ncbi:MAG: apolipoprotein N-acyltransferase [Phycisphaerales bacterium]|nr:apolipoprotein N-acyltransferase [Phycisphaerales bacterium]
MTDAARQDEGSASAATGRRRVRVARSAVLALLHIVLFAAAFPPFNVWPTIFLALIPIAMLADPQPRRAFWRPGLMMWLAGILLYLFEHRWQLPVSAVGYPLGTMVMAAYPACFVILLRAIRRRCPRIPLTLLVPTIWTALEVVRGEIAFGGYAFFLLAHPTIAATALPQCADLLGTYAVSFLVAMPAGVVLDVLRARQARRGLARCWIALTVGAYVIALSYGSWRLTQAPDPATARTLHLAAVQTNVPQSNKLRWSLEQAEADFLRAAALTWEAAELGPLDAIVWPETMVPTGFGLNREAVDEMRRERIVGADFADAICSLEQAVQERYGALLIVGAAATEGLRFEPIEGSPERLHPTFDRLFNSVFLIRDGVQSEQRYDKLYLTPFGETIPYVSGIDWLERLFLVVGAGGMSFDLSPGDAPVALTIPTSNGPVHVGTPICFEATSARICRRLVYQSGPGWGKYASALINVTNDGWFGDAVGGREQHLQAARFRCIELRVPMLRSANTGISAVIDSSGRLIAAGPIGRSESWNVDGVVRGDLPLDPRVSLFGRLGGVFGWAVLVALAIIGFTAALAGRKEHT